MGDINKVQMLNNMQMMEELKSRQKEQRRDYYSEHAQPYDDEHNPSDDVAFVDNEYHQPEQHSQHPHQPQQHHQAHQPHQHSHSLQYDEEQQQHHAHQHSYHQAQPQASLQRASSNTRKKKVLYSNNSLEQSHAHGHMSHGHGHGQHGHGQHHAHHAHVQGDSGHSQRSKK